MSLYQIDRERASTELLDRLPDQRPMVVQRQMMRARERNDWAEYRRLTRTNEPR